MKAESLKEKAVAAAAAVSFLFSLLSLFLEGASHPAALVSGALGLLVAPAAAVQQRKLTQVEALDQTNDAMEEEANRLAAENKRLTAQVQEMEETVLNLQTMEETLETLQQVRGQTAQDLERQVRESREILDRLGGNVKTAILQNLVSILLAVDDDRDGKLTDDEIDLFIHQVETVQGVELKEDRLRRAVMEQGRSVAAVMEVARHLLTDEVPASENIFSFVEDDDDDDDDDDISDDVAGRRADTVVENGPIQSSKDKQSRNKET